MSCKTPTLIILTLCAAGVASAASPRAQRATGRSFSVPIPSGFSWLNKPLGNRLDAEIARVGKAGGVLLKAEQRPKLTNPFVASIVILPAPGGESVNASVSNCKQTAQTMSQMVNATLQSASLIALAHGKACQWLLAGKDAAKPHRRGRGTVIAQGKDVWVVTCNFDARDSAGDSACKQVLAGWRFGNALKPTSDASLARPLNPRKRGSRPTWR
ncbi:MAG: hypothetical protein H6707_17400 [Deltaproteobacteria bacterium]|nr:hypothetical protein [Deltaproteobacteria bacterium]